MKSIDRPIVSILFAVSMMCVGSAYAANGVITTSTTSTREATPAEIAQAKPHVNPLKAPDTSAVKAETLSLEDTPGARVPSGADGATRGLRASGSFGIPYTSTRVELSPILSVSGSAPNFLSTTYPYSTIGRLTFTTPSGSAHCSASLIQRSVLVTAAHCVQDFGTPTLFTNFKFQPGHYGPAGATAAQKAPFGTWTTRVVARSNTWVDGTDIGSGSARDNDVAVFIIAKKAGKFIGDRTGWLGYGWNNYSFVSSSKTGNLAVAATSTLGYPALMDAGRIMQRADGPTYTTTVSGAGQLWQGNNFTGGASGGPWIVNFVSIDPVLSGGAVIGDAPNMAVVGVTSWGSEDPNAPKDNYSSRFRQNTRFPNADYGGYGAGNIGALVNDACTSDAGGGKTFAQLGFCD
jgi:hypothetical protein